MFGTTIGVYQVLDKWLKARKEIKLSLEDITHLQSVMTVFSRYHRTYKQLWNKSAWNNLYPYNRMGEFTMKENI